MGYRTTEESLLIGCAVIGAILVCGVLAIAGATGAAIYAVFAG